jgi:hypothetical protein
VSSRVISSPPSETALPSRTHVGKADRQIRLKRQDLVDLGTGEGADPRLLLPRLRRTHGEAGNADDAVLLNQRIQHLRGLFGQADDALRQVGQQVKRWQGQGRHSTGVNVQLY